MTMGGAFGVEREDGTSSFFGLSLLAQDLSSYAGKLLRLNDDGSPPKNNPFVGREGAKPEIYSLGHRNQQGLALHPDTGVPFATEHGVQGGDELNAIEPGGNYGWLGGLLRPSLRRAPHRQAVLAGRHEGARRLLGAFDRPVGTRFLHSRSGAATSSWGR